MAYLSLYSFFVFSGLAASQEGAVNVTWQVGQQVVTSSGPVVGHPAKARAEVSEYLGIRFANAARFMAPQKFVGTAPIEAAKFGPGCPGAPTPIDGLTAILGANPTSEDCLFVNVWTKPQSGEKKKAVMLWIYGGGFSTGDSSGNDGTLIADNQDVVVVSVNYRTNILGFPGAPGLPDQNVGLLDQRLGVEWVRDNIARFGGDPARITLFGESAGGSSVDYYAFAWTEDPIVNAFITESGTVHMTGPFAPTPDREPAWFAMSEKVGCGGKEAGPASVQCAQNKTLAEIRSAMPQGQGLQQITGFYGPTYDDKLVFRNPDERAKAGLYIKKPMITGSNNNESALFATIAPGGKPEELAGIDQGFRCGAAKAAAFRFQNQTPVWRYHYAGNKPGSTTGVSHAADISQIFGEAKNGTLSATFQNAWGAFAKDPLHGLDRLGWPGYNPDSNTLVRLGYNLAVEPDFIAANTYDQACAAPVAPPLPANPIQPATPTRSAGC